MLVQSKNLSEMVAVLIDTWWNVNRVRAKVFEEGKAVLIDTWWNVNLTSTGYVRRDFSFNRYMVECELDRIKLEGMTLTSF